MYVFIDYVFPNRKINIIKECFISDIRKIKRKTVKKVHTKGTIICKNKAYIYIYIYNVLKKLIIYKVSKKEVSKTYLYNFWQ